MQKLGREYAILYDTSTQRGWLVNVQNTLLHLLRSSLINDSEELSLSSMTQSAGLSVLEGTEVSTEPQSGPLFILDELNKIAEQSRDQSDIILRSDAFRQFRKIELSNKDSIGPNGTAETVYVEQLLRKLIEGLWKMVENASKAKHTESRILEGYDFWDFSRCRYLKPRAVEIGAVAGGWIEFTRSLQAITLFASGLNTLLRPDHVEGQPICERCLWNSEVPTGQNVMAISMSDLERLHRPIWRSSSPGDREVKGGFSWSRPAACFHPCSHSSEQSCSDSPRIQAFRRPLDEGSSPRSLKDRLRKATLPFKRKPKVKTSGEVKSEGAILLGDVAHWMRRKRRTRPLAISSISARLTGLRSSDLNPPHDAKRELQNTTSQISSIDDGERAASASKASNILTPSTMINLSGMI